MDFPNATIIIIPFLSRGGSGEVGKRGGVGLRRRERALCSLLGRIASFIVNFCIIGN